MKNTPKGYCKYCGQASDVDHEECAVKSANRKGFLDAFVVTILLLIYFFAVS